MIVAPDVDPRTASGKKVSVPQACTGQFPTGFRLGGEGMDADAVERVGLDAARGAARGVARGVARGARYRRDLAAAVRFESGPEN